MEVRVARQTIVLLQFWRSVVETIRPKKIATKCTLLLLATKARQPMIIFCCGSIIFMVAWRSRHARETGDIALEITGVSWLGW
jgi:hypothetical protein